jgi:2-haloacid dehalogenase
VTNPHQAIVFDFGGVLIDWDPRYLYRKFFDGHTAAMERFLGDIDFMAWNLKQDQGRPFADGVAELSAQFPHYAQLIQAYDQRWEESIGGPIQSTVDILRALKEAGYPLYGLSNWSAEKFHLFRPKYPFFSWFDDILVSGEVKRVKPDPEIFTLFLDRIRRTARECVYIDDSAANVATANRLGFTAIHFVSPGQLAADLQHLGLFDANGQRASADPVAPAAGWQSRQ